MTAVKAWWDGRDPREQRMLGVGLVVVAVMLVWALIWKPLDDARLTLAESNGRLAADVASMRAAAVELRGGSAGEGDDASRARAGQSLLAVADAGIRDIGLGGSLKRIEPAGDGRVRLRLEAVSFDPLAAWLETLTVQQGIRVAEIAATRTAYAGQVDILLVLEDP